MNIKKAIAIFIILLGLSIDISAQSFFQKSFRGIQGASGLASRQTSDGGYVIFGNTSGIGTHSCFYLVRLNPNGDTIWTRAYCNSNYNFAWSLELATDGGFIMTGYSTIVTNNIILLKSDSSGTLEWVKKYDGVANEIPYGIRRTFDNGYVICGYTESFGYGNRDLFIIKVNANGDTAWTKTYGGSMNEAGLSIEQTADSGFILTGYGFGIWSSYFILKTDAIGNLHWSKNYTGNGNFDARKCLITPDGGFIIMGTVSANMFLAKTDASGDTLWFKYYGGADYYWGEAIALTADSGYAVTGVMMDSTGTATAYYLMRIDNSGNVKWNNTFNVVGGGNSKSVVTTADGGFNICGWAEIFDTITGEIYFIKTDSAGYTGCHESFRNIVEQHQPLIVTTPIWNVSSANFTVSNETFTSHSGGTYETICSPLQVALNKSGELISVFPNPARDLFTIIARNSEISFRIELFNHVGQLLRRKDFHSTVQIDCSDLPKGIYLIRLIGNYKIETMKIFLM